MVGPLSFSLSLVSRVPMVPNLIKEQISLEPKAAHIGGVQIERIRRRWLGEEWI
jgi:hypothetical protein